MVMSLMHFEPFRTIRDLDRITSQLMSGTAVPIAMPMDVWREGHTYHIDMDLPGVERDAVEVNVERSTLTVSARRQAGFGTGSDGDGGRQSDAARQVQVLVAERPQGRFSRQLVLGESLDAAAVRADYTNGVLHLTIPVREAAQPRRIDVSQGEDGEPASQPRISGTDGGQEGSQ
jgi:HSP20 family protein